MYQNWMAVFNSNPFLWFLPLNKNEDDEIQKVFMVVESDAVGHPGAVVVHLQDAFLALAAVVRSLRLVVL